MNRAHRAFGSPRSRRAGPVRVVASIAAVTLAASTASCAPAAREAAVAGARQPGAQRTPYPGGTWEPGAARYGAAAREEASVSMEDGVELRASVAYPTDPATGRRAGGRFPVLVEMTPYSGTSGPAGPNAYFVEHGYIYVVVRPRGTAGSAGEVQQFSSRDGLDGRAVVDWVAHRLDGSDGRVGLVGCSYPGATALATAAQLGADSPVRAVIASCIGLEMQHREVWTTNGLPNAALTAYAPNAGRMMGDQPSVSAYFGQFHRGVMAGGPEAYQGYWRDRLPLEWARRIAEARTPVLL